MHKNVLNKEFGKSDKEGNDITVTWSFFSLHRISSQETRAIKDIDLNKINETSFHHKLDQQLLNELPNVINFVRINVTSVNKNSLKDIGNTINDFVNTTAYNFKKSFIYFELFHLFRIFKNLFLILILKINPKINIVVIFFIGKLANDNKLRKLFSKCRMY